MEALLRLNKYRERGSQKIKAYVPAGMSHLFLGVRGIEYKGATYPASVSYANKRRTGLKIYVPTRVCRDIWEYTHILVRLNGPDNPVLEIVSPLNKCRLCGEPTASPDRLCFGKHFESGCSRCGRRVSNHTLCTECLTAYARACHVI